MILPLIISALSVLSAGAMAYGTHAAWANHHWGLALIMIARRLQWPLAAVSILLCIVLLVLVISGRRRVWWLIALAPVLMLFVHRFYTRSINRYAVVDEPTFVSANDAGGFLDDAAFVVGVEFNGESYAYPYAALFRSPVIVQSDRDKRLLLIWSAKANAAAAIVVSRDITARQLDIVSDPADSLLLMDTRRGQFIAGLTGLSPGGEKPMGFFAHAPVMKTMWGTWRRWHPDSRVMSVPLATTNAPSRALPLKQPVTLLATTRPVAVPSDRVGADPINIVRPGATVFVFRDPATGMIKAFDRHLEEDLTPRFIRNRDRTRNAVLIDLDTNTGWNANGVAVDGDKERRGHKLTPIDVQEEIEFSALKFWQPNVELIEPAADEEQATQPSLERRANPHGADRAPTRARLKNGKHPATSKQR